MLLYFKTKTCIQIEHSNIKLIFITYLLDDSFWDIQDILRYLPIVCNPTDEQHGARLMHAMARKLPYGHPRVPADMATLPDRRHEDCGQPVPSDNLLPHHTKKQ